MPLPEILAAIDDEATEQIAAIRQDAKARTEVILGDADERADEERQRLGASRDADARRTASRMVAQARLDADRALRSAQEELYRTAVAAAGDHLSATRDTPSYREVFTDLVREAHTALADARTLAVDPRDEELARTTLSELGLTLEISPHLETWGGVTLSTGDGRMVENTLESRLYKADPALRRLAVSMCPELVGEAR